MRFLVDENLPPRLVGWLASGGHTAEHVMDLNLAGRSDGEVWAAAQARTALVLSRDGDFLALAHGCAVGGTVRLAFGNCPNTELLRRLEAAWSEVEARCRAGERAIVIT